MSVLLRILYVATLPVTILYIPTDVRKTTGQRGGGARNSPPGGACYKNTPVGRGLSECHFSETSFEKLPNTASVILAIAMLQRYQFQRQPSEWLYCWPKHTLLTSSVPILHDKCKQLEFLYLLKSRIISRWGIKQLIFMRQINLEVGIQTLSSKWNVILRKNIISVHSP